MHYMVLNLKKISEKTLSMEDFFKETKSNNFIKKLFIHTAWNSDQ